MNKGLDIQKEIQDRSVQDWLLGSKDEVTLVPRDERLNYLPKGETQKGAEDTRDCASRAPVNVLEAKFNYLLKNNKLPPLHEKFLRENGYVAENGVEFSDAFIAILSGTTKEGNSLKAPLETIRKNGLIPKRKLPLKKWMTWEDYHDSERVTGSLEALGQRFLSYFQINYERGADFYYDDYVIVGGYAWPQPVEGAYPAVNHTPNHAWVNVEPEWIAFDNYPDQVDGDYIKKLDKAYNFLPYCYRVYVSDFLEPVSWWVSLWRGIMKIYEYLPFTK